VGCGVCGELCGGGTERNVPLALLALDIDFAVSARLDIDFDFMIMMI
jgi:hypothetical protein